MNISEKLTKSKEKVAVMSEDITNLLETIFSQYPELKDVDIKTFAPKDEYDLGGYYELVVDEEGNVTPTIFVSEGNTEALKPLLEKRKHSVKINAELLGIDPADFTPELLQQFIVAHELGHLLDYIRNYKSDPNLPGVKSVEEMEFHRDIVLSNSLPVPDMSPDQLARDLEGIEGVDLLLERYPQLQNYSRVAEITSVDDLLRLQETEYRNSAPERFADEFAALLLQQRIDETKQLAA